MSRSRRRALLATFALGASLLAVAPVAPAQATTATSVSKPGPKAKVYRRQVTRAPGAHAARAVEPLTVVPGAAATPTSVWELSYQPTYVDEQGTTTPCTTPPAAAAAAFKAAVDIWAGIIHSTQKIRVGLCFAALGQDVLGFAGPSEIIPLSSGGDGTSWYPVALAEAISGADKNAGHIDIDAEFTNDPTGIYYGTDSNPPSGSVDFESTVLHELGHGLGFTGSADYYDGDCFTVAPHYESPRFIYDYFNVTGPGPTGGQRMISMPNGSAALKAAFTSNDVYWDGANAKAANGGNRVKLYAPTPWECGSSLAHLDEDTFPAGDKNSLMTPYEQNREVIHSPGPIVVAMMQDMGWNAVLDVPAAPTGVIGEPDDASVDLRWAAATPNGSPVTGYTIHVSDGTTTTTFASPGAGTTRLVTGLSNAKSYTLTVSATNAVGEGPPSAASSPVHPAPDVTAPTATVTSQQTTGIGPAVGTYTFTGADAGHANPVLTFSCTFDAQPAQTCTSPAPYSYADGTTHTFSVSAIDHAGNVGAPATTGSWTADGLAPTVVAPALPTYTVASTIGQRAYGSDPNGVSPSGVKDFDFRYRRAAYSGGWSALTYPATWQAVTHAVSLPAGQGYTYCFGARSRDNVGNVSPWSPEQCTSTAIDDRGLYASAGWTRGNYYKHFLQTVTQTSTAGVTLTRTNVQAKRLALVAVKCAKCGTVGVYFNGKLIKNVNLNQAATAYQVIFPIISFPSLQSGTVVIKPMTKGAVNYVDGFVMSKV